VRAPLLAKPATNQTPAVKSQNTPKFITIDIIEKIIFFSLGVILREYSSPISNNNEETTKSSPGIIRRMTNE
jgi:hypothetical protein